MKIVCPQCGFATETLQEGCCEECHNENQKNLDEHNARFDFWENCTDEEKDYYVHKAAGIY